MGTLGGDGDLSRLRFPLCRNLWYRHHRADGEQQPAGLLHLNWFQSSVAGAKKATPKGCLLGTVKQFKSEPFSSSDASPAQAGRG